LSSEVKSTPEILRGYVEPEGMPIHDWTRVDSGLFHSFHQDWIGTLARALNAGLLPPDYFAIREQSIRGPVPDVLTLRLGSLDDESAATTAQGLAVAAAAPRARLVRRADETIYVRKADRVTVRHRHGQVVAVIEVVSPGNKASKGALRDFVEQTTELINQGVHLLVVDLLPPSKRDPQGIHQAIWDEFSEDDFELPAEKRLTVASYDAGPPAVAYVELVSVGDPLPEMPLFLKPEFYVPVPLEETYRSAWDEFFPAPLKVLLESTHPNPASNS
jgi:hypothetical protein